MKLGPLSYFLQYYLMKQMVQAKVVVQHLYNGYSDE